MNVNNDPVVQPNALWKYGRKSTLIAPHVQKYVSSNNFLVNYISTSPINKHVYTAHCHRMFKIDRKLSEWARARPLTRSFWENGESVLFESNNESWIPISFYCQPRDDWFFFCAIFFSSFSLSTIFNASP